MRPPAHLVLSRPRLGPKARVPQCHVNILVGNRRRCTGNASSFTNRYPRCGRPAERANKRGPGRESIDPRLLQCLASKGVVAEEGEEAGEGAEAEAIVGGKLSSASE